MLVSISELAATSLYPEIITAITRNNPGNAELQISAAEELVKTYLFKYDLNAVFGSGDTPPSHPSELVKKLVKIIASYYLVRMASPNVNVELFRLDYEDALRMLADIRDGNNVLNLPYAPAEGTDDGTDVAESFFFASEPKQHHYF